ncbi:hypothetical protein QFC21_007122 [Naganishia friedmannii]|uniref:Uncharacterized protein n=1 Tax=Naganishia friedmannii TaxID=89922 RepID=A0ACC2UZD1_9TREE|nr:hypothetical protein QFC21_007122 [Naganishia friedmannii]
MNGTGDGHTQSERIMLDVATRRIKERILRPFLSLIPIFIHPTHLTFVGFCIGLLIPLCSAFAHPRFALTAWLANRLLDGLDGTLARQRQQQTNWGGYLDIVCDFTIYSLIPIGIAYSRPETSSASAWTAVAYLLASFHVNNVILFYLAAVLPPPSAAEIGEKEMTSLRLLPALVEGTESLAIFTVMIALPNWFLAVTCTMTTLVVVNVLQRTWVAREAFAEEESGKILKTKTS